ncbi:adhesive plaque matrix protein 2-like [Mytilus trossulus]|uniref:adhesive plaque matrix protein 2-like n=1 Tax=Mytilus trossulus TaxID=6551 RepID=UPI0030069169
MCINECTKTTNCLSVFYIHKTCRLNNVYFSSTTGLVPVNGSEYFGSGSSCSPNPCLHGGTCSKAGSSFKCDCSADRRGSRCETEPCNPDPCVHGTCIKSDVAAGFRCHCREDIKGYLCDIDDD